MTRQQYIFQNLKVTRELRRSEPVESGYKGGDGTWVTTKGFKSVPDGTEEVTYSVKVDLDTLAAMARKAAKSKGQRCYDGPITVVVVNRRKICP